MADTLMMARRLKKVGMEEAHAEAVAESLRDAVTGSVATKQDLNAATPDLWKPRTSLFRPLGASDTAVWVARTAPGRWTWPASQPCDAPSALSRVPVRRPLALPPRCRVLGAGH